MGSVPLGRLQIRLGDEREERSVDVREIESVFYDPSTTYHFPRCFQVATIVCHSNCRADKTDLCLPEWVYETIEAAGIRLQS